MIRNTRVTNHFACGTFALFKELYVYSAWTVGYSSDKQHHYTSPHIPMIPWRQTKSVSITGSRNRGSLGLALLSHTYQNAAMLTKIGHQLRQVLTDFQNYFSDTFGNKFEIKWSLEISSHLKRFVTLPCEKLILMPVSGIYENKNLILPFWNDNTFYDSSV